MTYMLNWADRRSIGQVILCSSSASSGSNPQEWFNDPSLNVHSKAGIADFQQKLLATAAGVRDRALAMQSEGVIVWDIDGQKCWQMDVALQKSIPIPVREGTEVQFRSEFFNILNRTNFRPPDA